MIRKSKRGGKRPGSGRPHGDVAPLQSETFRLSIEHRAAIGGWVEEHACATRSEALRQIIERVKR